MLSQAREWEQTGQFKQAIQCYIKMSTLTSDKESKVSYLLRAAELTIKFADTDEAIIFGRTLCSKLIEHKQFGTAAQLYMACNLTKDAIDTFILGNEWNKARRVARDYEPGLELYVENK